MLKYLKKTGQSGDTIVEVMVVLAILGLAISVSYATANRSLLNARQAQENSQASELVQSQVEALRTLTQIGTTPNVFTTALENYCLVPSGSTYVNQSGNSCNMGSVPYTINITYAVANDTFTITATWPDVLGEGNDTIQTIYRLHQTT
jgi:prepilin-type N-terminal cleavage/methylation domain-containing protein